MIAGLIGADQAGLRARGRPIWRGRVLRAPKAGRWAQYGRRSFPQGLAAINMFKFS